MFMTNQKQTKVSIFGEDIVKGAKSYDPENITWGVLLIFVGILLLLNTTGAISWNIWQQIWIYWPVLVILGGVQVILGHGWLARALISVVSLVIFGSLFVYILSLYAPQLTGWVPANLWIYINYWSFIKP